MTTVAGRLQNSALVTPMFRANESDLALHMARLGKDVVVGLSVNA